MYKDKRGLYREYVTINGKRKYFSGKTKKDVLLKLASFDVKQKQAQKFSDVAESWKEQNWDKLRFGSYRTYSPCLERALLKFGNKDIDQIKPIEIQSWLRELGTQYAQKTVSNHKCIMKQIFDFAIVDLGMDIWNPCDRVKLPQGLKKGTRNALSPQERQAILSTTKDDFQLGFVILFTGARLGEALALQMKDVNFKDKTVTISKSVGFHGNQPVLNPPKTAKGNRIVPLLPQLEERLRELKLPPDAYICSGDKPLTKTSLYRRWDSYCKRKNINIDRHTIRHEYASILYEAGIDVKEAQQLLGHAQISTTMDIYTHISESKMKQDFMKLANYFEA